MPIFGRKKKACGGRGRVCDSRAGLEGWDLRVGARGCVCPSGGDGCGQTPSARRRVSVAREMYRKVGRGCVPFFGLFFRRGSIRSTVTFWKRPVEMQIGRRDRQTPGGLHLQSRAATVREPNSGTVVWLLLLRGKGFRPQENDIFHISLLFPSLLQVDNTTPPLRNQDHAVSLGRKRLIEEPFPWAAFPPRQPFPHLLPGLENSIISQACDHGYLIHVLQICTKLVEFNATPSQPPFCLWYSNLSRC